jgi:hypothetical protein
MKFDTDSCLTDLVNRYLKIGDIEYAINEVRGVVSEKSISEHCRRLCTLYTVSITDGDIRMLSNLFKRDCQIDSDLAFTMYNIAARFGPLEILKYIKTITSDCAPALSVIEISESNPDRRVCRYLFLEIRRDRREWLRKFKKYNLQRFGKTCIEMEKEFSDFEERYSKLNSQS